MPDFRVRSTGGSGTSSMRSAIRSAASGSFRGSRYIVRPASKPALISQGSRRVVRQAMLMVTTTTSLAADESQFEDVDDEDDSDEDDDDVENVTAMAQPNKAHHYSLVFCHRTLMGHARRERIELDDAREPVEFIWGEDGMLSTRFEFSIVYGSVGPSGRRRALTCRAKDAEEYLQWTQALRMAMEHDKRVKYTRSTHARTITSSKAPSNAGSFFDLDVLEEHQQQLEREAALPGPTSPTTATAATAIAPPDADVVQASALKPVPVDIAAVYKVPKSGREVNVTIKPPAGTRLQRRKLSTSGRRGSVHSSTLKSTDNERDARSSVVTVTRRVHRRRRSSSATRRLSSTPSKTRARKMSLSSNYSTPPRKDSWRPRSPDTNSGSKRNRLRVSVGSEPEEKRPRKPSSPIAILGAVPMLQASFSPDDSPLDFIDAYERPSTALRTTEFVNSLVKIAGVSSAKQRQQLLRRQRTIPTDYGLYVVPREPQSPTDSWLLSRRTSKLNLDTCEFEDAKSTTSHRSRRKGESWIAYLKAMECEL